MKNKFKTQVEVQGTKKLDSVKGVQALSLDEMKKIEGGNIFRRIWNWIMNHIVPYDGPGIGVKVQF